MVSQVKDVVYTRRIPTVRPSRALIVAIHPTGSDCIAKSISPGLFDAVVQYCHVRLQRIIGRRTRESVASVVVQFELVSMYHKFVNYGWCLHSGWIYARHFHRSLYIHSVEYQT